MSLCKHAKKNHYRCIHFELVISQAEKFEIFTTIHILRPAMWDQRKFLLHFYQDGGNKRIFNLLTTNNGQIMDHYIGVLYRLQSITFQLRHVLLFREQNAK